MIPSAQDGALAVDSNEGVSNARIQLLSYLIDSHLNTSGHPDQVKIGVSLQE